MRTITGGLVILAGAVMFAGGEISRAIYMSFKGYPSEAGALPMFGGVLLFIFGLLLIVAYRHDQ